MRVACQVAALLGVALLLGCVGQASAVDPAVLPDDVEIVSISDDAEAIAGLITELVREAARVYIERRRRMSTVIESIRETVRQRGITEEDVAAEIAAVRAKKK